MKKLLLLFFLVPMFTMAQDAKEIVQKADQKMKGASSKSTMRIDIVRPTYTRQMEMITWTLGTDYSLVYITTPKKDEGSTFLKRQKEIWNWIPNIERVIKLPPSMMSQNWMGTDFTNDDMVKQSSIVVDYSHKLVGKETIEGYECYKIELTPKPDAAVVWGKIYMWIDVKESMQLKIEFYNEDDFLVNTMLGKSPKEFDGKILPSVMEMIPEDKPGNKTIMTTLDLKFDIPVSENFFSTRNMKSVSVTD